MVVEIGLITPPVGMNVFSISNMPENATNNETFIGILPFLVSDLLRIMLLLCKRGLKALFPVEYQMSKIT